MNAERREQEPHSPIPEMPGIKHIPALVERFNNENNLQVIKSRNRLFVVLGRRGADPKDSKFLYEIAALAAWIHRNDIRLTGEPYIVHTLEVAAMALAHPAIPRDQIRRAGAGLILHDSIEDNQYVTREGLIPHAGLDVANDIDNYYSKKRASDKANGTITKISPEDYLAKFLEGDLIVKLGKVTDREYNMDHMPPDEKGSSKVAKMYDRYFRKETDAMLRIIKSMGNSLGRKVYEEYRKIHNANKRPDDPEIPPFDESEQ